MYPSYQRLSQGLSSSCWPICKFCLIKITLIIIRDPEIYNMKLSKAILTLMTILFQDKQIDKCFEIDDKQTCDLFLQENCAYTGTVILEPPIGTIADPKECEQLCFQFNAIGCTYWVFDQTLKKCSLRGENSKGCSTWAGPKSPTFDECQGKNSNSSLEFFRSCQSP